MFPRLSKYYYSLDGVRGDVARPVSEVWVDVVVSGRSGCVCVDV